MRKRRGCAVGALVVLISGCWLAPSAVSPALADEGRPAPSPVLDIVAVGRAPGKIVLATPAAPAGSNHWRFRTIALRPGEARAQGVLLSRSGTKALVIFAKGNERVFDLTQKLAGIDANRAGAAHHRLPGQLFPVSRVGNVCLMDDAAQIVDGSCRVAAQAVVHEDGRILYAREDGRLFVARWTAAAPHFSPEENLPYRVPPGARDELLAGRNGERYAFLVLVEQAGEVRIVDPTRADGVLGSYKSWEVATLRAMLEFGSAVPNAANGAVTDAALEALAGNLAKESKASNLQWSFYRVRPELALYGPVMEFAPNEPAYPSDFEIWHVLNPIAKGTTREAYQAAYDTLGQERFGRCKVYFRQTSFPGSWLLEFWYYYPFDEGKPHPHIHDSEHIFIEVDKLGGAVRSVLASAHGPFAPNNNYSTFLPGAAPVELPLYAFAEFEKHAMSPDINRDGQFTRGVDVNIHWERYDVWGVRDLGSKKGHLMEPYRPYMTLPRPREDRMALANAPDYFPGLKVNADKATCGLVPFPEEPPCLTCPVASPEGARTHLVAHGDARRPKDIYKPWVLPWRELRIGWALFDHGGSNRQIYAAYVFNLKHLTAGHFPFPSRLALEGMWSPATQHFGFTSGTQSVVQSFSSSTYFGARYERFLTNTQGFYGGITPLYRKVVTTVTGAGPIQPSSSFDYQGVWYRFGYILELPSHKRGNMTHHLGAEFHGTTFRFEWRASLGLFRRLGRDNFGIKPGDRNPYE